GGDGGCSKTTVTCWPSAEAQRSSRSTSSTIARRRSFHQPSGRVPITFMPSTIHRTFRRYVSRCCREHGGGLGLVVLLLLAWGGARRGRVGPTSPCGSRIPLRP